MVTPLGVLATEDVEDYEPHAFVGGGQDGITLTFEPYGAAFDVVGADRPKYWVVSLLNFVSAFPQRSRLPTITRCASIRPPWFRTTCQRDYGKPRSRSPTRSTS